MQMPHVSQIYCLLAELSEEDLELKQNLELMLERIKDSDPGIQSNALQVWACSSAECAWCCSL